MSRFGGRTDHGREGRKDGEGESECVCVGGQVRGYMKTVLSAQFRYEPRTALKKAGGS